MLDIFATMPSVVFCIVICVCKIIEITISSLKTVFLIKGQKLSAALLAFVECLIWGLIISGIINTLGTNLYWLLSYCLGYSIGWYVGSLLEAKIAIGTIDVRLIVPENKSIDVESYLSENNFGYYISKCRGKNGPREKFDTVLPRKRAREIRKDISEICEGDIFVTNYDISYVHGGYGVRANK